MAQHQSAMLATFVRSMWDVVEGSARHWLSVWPPHANTVMFSNTIGATLAAGAVNLMRIAVGSISQHMGDPILVPRRIVAQAGAIAGIETPATPLVGDVWPSHQVARGEILSLALVLVAGIWGC